VALAAAGLYARSVDNTQKAPKSALTSALDTGSNAVQGVVHSKWTKVAGVAAVVLGAFHYRTQLQAVLSDVSTKLQGN
jgi:succinate dehydrogenase hydrophobic anchor subunit